MHAGCDVNRRVRATAKRSVSDQAQRMSDFSDLETPINTSKWSIHDAQRVSGVKEVLAHLPGRWRHPQGPPRCSSP